MMGKWDLEENPIRKSSTTTTVGFLLHSGSSSCHGSAPLCFSDRLGDASSERHPSPAELWVGVWSHFYWDKKRFRPQRGQKRQKQLLQTVLFRNVLSRNVCSYCNSGWLRDVFYLLHFTTEEPSYHLISSAVCYRDGSRVEQAAWAQGVSTGCSGAPRCSPICACFSPVWAPAQRLTSNE